MLESMLVVFEVVLPVGLAPRVVRTVTHTLVVASAVVARGVLSHLWMPAQEEQMAQCFPGKAQWWLCRSLDRSVHPVAVLLHRLYSSCYFYSIELEFPSQNFIHGCDNLLTHCLIVIDHLGKLLDQGSFRVVI